MAKVARASVSAVQSAVESQQLLPALQQLLARCCTANRPAHAAGCDAGPTSIAALDPPSSLTGDAAGAAASCTDAHQGQTLAEQWRQKFATLPPSAAGDLDQSAFDAGSRGGRGSRSGTQQGSSSTSTTSSSSSSDSGAKVQADPLTLALEVLHGNANSRQLTPSNIVQQLDKYIVGQPVGVQPCLPGSLPCCTTSAAADMAAADGSSMGVYVGGDPNAASGLLDVAQARSPQQRVWLAAGSPRRTPLSNLSRCLAACGLCSFPPCSQDAKRAVAVALRNRWRRHMLPADLAEEVSTPGPWSPASTRRALLSPVLQAALAARQTSV